MEMNLALIATHNSTISDGCGQINRQLLEGFNPRVELKETRSSYSLNVHFPDGFRREDISLEMDNTRALLLRGQACLEGLGIVAWTWHLMEHSAGRSFRRPFKIPHNVNVGSITGSFHRGVLHVEMPKLRWNRFSPYEINGSTRNRHYYDPPVETTQAPDQADEPDPTVQDFADELRAEANELIGHDNTEAQISGAHVAADHSDSLRSISHCSKEKETINTSEDACSSPTERSVDDFSEVSSLGSVCSDAEEDDDLKSLIEKMKNVSTSSENREDQQQQQPPDPCRQEEDEEMGKIMEEGMEHQITADHKEKALQEVDDYAANSYSFMGIESIVEQEAIRELKSEAEEENPVEKVIPANSRGVFGKDADEQAIDTHDFHPKRFLSTTKSKIVLSVLVSAVALITARKLMRRS